MSSKSITKCHHSLQRFQLLLLVKWHKQLRNSTCLPTPTTTSEGVARISINSLDPDWHRYKRCLYTFNLRQSSHCWKMDRINFPSYEALVDSESSPVHLYPNIDFKSFRTMHYLDNMSHFFGNNSICFQVNGNVSGFSFFSFYFLLQLVHGKTFLVFEHSFWFIFIFQILTFGSSLVTQKVSKASNMLTQSLF